MNDIEIKEKIIGPYSICFAQSEADRFAVQQLRYRIFCEELGASSSHVGVESDQFDLHCDHLMINHRESGQVIGTYRMQTLESAIKGAGFYTNQEFCCHDIPSDVIENAVEIGRLCIHPTFRSRKVLMLLWRGVAMYLSATDKRYLFGCTSLLSLDSDDAANAWGYFIRNDSIHPTIHVGVRENYCLNIRPSNSINGYKIQPLISVYLRLGAKICSDPAIDRTFKTIDFLSMFDTHVLTTHQRAMFFDE